MNNRSNEPDFYDPIYWTNYLFSQYFPNKSNGKIGHKENTNKPFEVREPTDNSQRVEIAKSNGKKGNARVIQTPSNKANLIVFATNSWTDTTNMGNKGYYIE